MTANVSYTFNFQLTSSLVQRCWGWFSSAYFHQATRYILFLEQLLCVEYLILFRRIYSLLINFIVWTETQWQTNDDACNHSQWPEVNIRQQYGYYIRTGSLSAPDVKSTDNETFKLHTLWIQLLEGRLVHSLIVNIRV